MPSNEQILKQLSLSLRSNFGADVKDVILFGSRAGGTSHEDSDFDVLIVFNRVYNHQFEDQVDDVVYDLELEHDILIDNFLISTDDLQSSPRGGQPVFVQAIENGVYA